MVSLDRKKHHFTMLLESPLHSIPIGVTRVGDDGVIYCW